MRNAPSDRFDRLLWLTGLARPSRKNTLSPFCGAWPQSQLAAVLQLLSAPLPSQTQVAPDAARAVTNMPTATSNAGTAAGHKWSLSIPFEDNFALDPSAA